MPRCNRGTVNLRLQGTNLSGDRRRAHAAETASATAAGATSASSSATTAAAGATSAVSAAIWTTIAAAFRSSLTWSAALLLGRRG